MTIEIHSSELEGLIAQRISSGAFANPEEVVLHALRLLVPKALTGAELIRVMQASPHKDVDLESSREPMPVREGGF